MALIGGIITRQRIAYLHTLTQINSEQQQQQTHIECLQVCVWFFVHRFQFNSNEESERTSILSFSFLIAHSLYQLCPS